jgi:hypothetical protein
MQDDGRQHVQCMQKENTMRTIIRAMSLALLVTTALPIGGARSNDEIEKAVAFADEHGMKPLTKGCKDLLRYALQKVQDNEPVRSPSIVPRINRCLGGEYGGIVRQFFSDGQPGAMHPSVSVEEYDGITYLTITDFHDRTKTEFEDAIRGRVIKHLVINLTDNAGGFVDVMLAILDNFTPKLLAPAVTFEGRKKETHRSMPGPVWNELRGAYITILVDRNTASAAEIFTLALQRWYSRRVIVVGERTFGKDAWEDSHPFGSAEVWVVGGTWRYGGPETDCKAIQCSVRGTGVIPDRKIKPTIEEARKVAEQRRDLVERVDRRVRELDAK